MTNQVGPATAGGSVTAPGSGATGVSGASAVVGTGSRGQDVAPFVSQVPGTPVSFPSFHGRAVSWTAVSIIMVAFLAGGLALTVGPIWWLFWASLGVAVLGGLIAMATGIFDDWY
ncbi:MAG TPA: hypothetical protein VLM11_02020 [Streptosporangiaceae bacterium]|nr:hypothetical protein [Streptosporangiaceae bacterium]